MGAHAVVEAPTKDAAAVLDALAALRAEVAALTARVLVLEQKGRGPRDAADEALLRALRSIVQGGTFSAQDVIERGRLDREFRGLLEDADIETTADLGYLLRRCVGVAGLGRVGKNGSGIVWRFDDASSIVTRSDD